MRQPRWFDRLHRGEGHAVYRYHQDIIALEFRRFTVRYTCIQVYNTPFILSALEEKFPQDRTKDNNGLLHVFRLLILCQRRRHLGWLLTYLSVAETYTEMPSALGLIVSSSKHGAWTRSVELHTKRDQHKANLGQAEHQLLLAISRASFLDPQFQVPWKKGDGWSEVWSVESIHS